MSREILLQKYNKRETPFYNYDLSVLQKVVNEAANCSRKYGYQVHYALKANNLPQILEVMCKAGFGADCVSGQEVKHALDNGFDSRDIVFAGVGKSDSEIELGIDRQIFSFNIESLSELKVIGEIARHKRNCASVSFRINPDVDAKTHALISTGQQEHKFGLSIDQLSHAVHLVKKAKYLKFQGIHVHIGSMISDMMVFENLCNRVNEIQNIVRNLGLEVHHLNMGGGLGIDYSLDTLALPAFDKYFATFHKHLEKREEQQIHFELGRSLVAACGKLITKVLYIKESEKTDFIVVDAGMNDLIRPALYQSVHAIENLSSKRPLKNYHVVGPVCESSDVFARNWILPETHRSDLLAIHWAGAYGQTMASNYNMRPMAKSYFEVNKESQIEETIPLEVNCS